MAGQGCLQPRHRDASPTARLVADVAFEQGPSRTADRAPAITAGEASPGLLDAVARMLRLLDHPTDAPVLAPLVEREILRRLLTGPFGDVIRQIGLPESNLPTSTARSDGSAITMPNGCGSPISPGFPA